AGPITSGPFPRQGLFSGISLSLSYDGAQAALGPLLALYRADGAGSWVVADEALNGEDLSPFYRIHLASFSDDFRRASADLAIGRAQLVVIDFNPASLNGAPSPGALDVSPRELPVDGSKSGVATARA